jgi:short-subunit dehydrogenase
MAQPESLYGPNASIVITGASSGIGAALAEHLAQYGGRVALVARREQRLQAVARRVREAGGTPLVVVCDVTDAAAVADAYRRVVAGQGEVTVAFLGAGTGDLMRLEGFSADRFKRLVEVNLFGVAHWLEHLLPPMVQRQRGTLVGISSLASQRGLPGNAGYCASKAGLSRMLESLRVEANPLGIQISVVEPGFVRSELTDRNRFKMPFLVETPEAARLIADAVAEGQGWIRFPWQMSTAMRLLGTLPGGLYDKIGARMAGKVRKRPAS